MSRIFFRALFLGLLVLLSGHAVAAGQDIELLGKIHGTRPPPGYYKRMAEDPTAYQYSRALIRKGLNLKELPPVEAGGRALARAMAPAFAGVERPQRSAVAGTFHFPLILGLYSDSPAPAPTYSKVAMQAEFFDGPQVNPAAVGTIPDFYGDISGGRVAIAGTTFDWVTTPLTQSQVTAGTSGLYSPARVGEFIVEIIKGLDDGSVDWGQFDNDGPDGIPNSGDDDGYVDVLAIMHPDPGGECNTANHDDHIWSHRWNLWNAAHFESGAWATQVKADLGWATSIPSAGNPDGFATIRILDYTIQSVTTCSGNLPNTIGVFAHELGHGFGLPDLYGVKSDQNGIGNWGLMGTGSWGCNGASPELPCHMSAWSKSILGWADVETLPSDTDLGTVTLPPVESSGKIYRIDSGDGSGEYLLLENRQKTDWDLNLYSPGLLVWHIDPAYVAEHWGSNTINSDGSHPGVWLRQADGRDDLNRNFGGRGDSNDPFPGGLQRTAFHFATAPSSVSHEGNAMGITLMEIQQVGSDITFHAVTGYQPLTMETVGSPTGTGLIAVDGVTSEEEIWIFNSAPFQTHTIEALGGVETATGYRVGFEGWSDGAPRVREYQTGFHGETFTANYGGTEVHLDVEIVSPVADISPGSVDFTPGDDEGWVLQGETVVVTAEPRTGFGFSGWTGALAGMPNPTTLTVDEPMEAGALFDLTFSTASNPATMEVEAATNYFLDLKVDNANQPVVWTLTGGSLPSGMSLDPDGRITGAAKFRGTFPLTFHVEDAIGLEGDISLALEVVDPVISIERLASPFLLSGTGLDFRQKEYLDQEGNVNGSYDLGDFRAFFLRNPNLPRSGDAEGIIRLLVPMGSLDAGHKGKEVVR